MESFLRAIVTSDATFERARAAMGKVLRAELEETVDVAIRRTLSIPGYEEVDIENMRPNTRRAYQSVLETLEGGPMDRYGETMRGIAYMRAKQGLPHRALFGLTDLTENQLGEIGTRCLTTAEELVAGALLSRAICDGARRVIIDAFQAVHGDALADVERLAGQFSSPLLPALPGVLVLPIVGAISPSRADKIAEALLRGIVEHKAHTAILDITGISDVDPTLAGHLGRITSAAGLLGARVVLVGVTPKVALILLDLHGDLGNIATYSTLAEALVAASRGATASGGARARAAHS